jgi:hypothetical protein
MSENMVMRQHRVAQRLAHQPPTRRAAYKNGKIATISRAEGGLHARVGRASILHYKANYIPVNEWTR